MKLTLRARTDMYPPMHPVLVGTEIKGWRPGRVREGQTFTFDTDRYSKRVDPEMPPACAEPVDEAGHTVYRAAKEKWPERFDWYTPPKRGPGRPPKPSKGKSAKAAEDVPEYVPKPKTTGLESHIPPEKKGIASLG